MKKCTVKSPANIAFIKYWGRTDLKTRQPANNSISMCLSELHSICTIEFLKKLKEDQIHFIDEDIIKPRELERIVKVLDRARKLGKTHARAKVVSRNNFPKATGIASSASGLSSVTMAAIGALEIDLSKKELSKLSRLASGSATRSIPDGFVEWNKGIILDDCYAKSIFPPKHWSICDCVSIVTKKMKKISSTAGHKIADTSPFYEIRIAGMEKKVNQIKKAIANKKFTRFGEILEAESFNMHSICFTSRPPIIYWESPTIEIIKRVTEWRKLGEIEAYCTIDAGPTVHVICEVKNAKKIKKRIERINGVDRVSVNYPSIGARFINKHLF